MFGLQLIVLFRFLFNAQHGLVLLSHHLFDLLYAPGGARIGGYRLFVALSVQVRALLLLMDGNEGAAEDLFGLFKVHRVDQWILTASESVLTITRLLVQLSSLGYCCSCVLLGTFLPMILSRRVHFCQLTRLIKPATLHRLLLPVRQLLLDLLVRGRPRHNIEVALSTAERGSLDLKEPICRQSELLLFPIGWGSGLLLLLLRSRSAITTLCRLLSVIGRLLLLLWRGLILGAFKAAGCCGIVEDKASGIAHTSTRAETREGFGSFLAEFLSLGLFGPWRRSSFGCGHLRTTPARWTRLFLPSIAFFHWRHLKSGIYCHF